MSDSKGLTVITSLPLTVSQQMPDWMREQGGGTGLEHLERSDFRIPEIKLMQGLSPELDTYKGIAVKDEYFHTGIMKNLGKSYRSIIILVNKRVVLWRPKNDQGGGILAMSDDSVTWKQGANKEFDVMLKGAKKPVKWKTGPNVMASGLLEFGTMNPEDDRSPPAAVKYFEYLEYLPDFENASPVVKRVKSTALDNAYKLNSYMLLQGIKTYGHVFEWVTDPRKGADGDWTVPLAKPAGYVDRQTMELMREMHAKYSGVSINIEQEDERAGGENPNSPAF